MFECENILQIDLNTQTINTWTVPGQLTAQFLGGRGLAAALSYRLIAEDCDPLGPGNVLSICNGLLTGTSAPAAARIHFCALSPLTGILGSSNAGGFFGPALRACNFQGIVLQGAAARPVYLEIRPDGARIRPAEHLWGLDTIQCEQRLKDSLDAPWLPVLSIGPAGENRCAMAAIMVGSHSAAGRTGMGAVMGAKRLKAIVIRNAGSPPSTGKEAAKARGDYLKPIVRNEMFKPLSTYGQSGYIPWCNEKGMLSTFNYQSGVFEPADRFCGSNLNGRLTRRRACAGCPVRCKADTAIAAGRYAGESGPRPEFESIAALGAKCGQADVDTVLHLSYQCNRLGLDTISAGSAVAFAMELFEKGIITAEDTGGMPLLWGDGGAQDRLLAQIATRRGFGGILADGVRTAAERIGRGSHRFAFHGNGLELCAYDPRASMSAALGYAVSGRGADFASIFPSLEYRWDAARAETFLGHRQSVNPFSPIGKAAAVRRCSLCSAVIDSLGICKVLALGIPAAFDLQAEARLVNAVSHWRLSADELFVAGERILCLERLFNLRRRGRHPLKDSLPRRFLTEALPRGASKNRRVDLKPMLAEYYRQMGWDKLGRPRRATVKRLGLEPYLHQRFTCLTGYN